MDAALGALALRALRSVYTPHLISSSASLNLPTPGISPALSLFLAYRSYFNFAKTTEFQWPNGLLKKATFKFIVERNYDTVAGGSGFLSFFPPFFPSEMIGHFFKWESLRNVFFCGRHHQHPSHNVQAKTSQSLRPSNNIWIDENSEVRKKNINH